MSFPESNHPSDLSGSESGFRQACSREEDLARSYEAARFGVVACLLFMAGGLYWTAAIGLLTISALTAYPVMISIGVAFSVMIFGAAFWTPRRPIPAFGVDSASYGSPDASISTYDSVTGLPTNRLFLSLLSQALIRAQQQSRQVAILMIELDHFTPAAVGAAAINCNLMYRIEAARVKSALRTSDTVARVGERTFAVLLDQVTGPEEVLAIAKKMQGTISLPVTLDAHELFLSSRIGIGLAAQGCQETAPLLEAASQALVTARAHGYDMFGLPGCVVPTNNAVPSPIAA